MNLKSVQKTRDEINSVNFEKHENPKVFADNNLYIINSKGTRNTSNNYFISVTTEIQLKNYHSTLHFPD